MEHNFIVFYIVRLHFAFKLVVRVRQFYHRIVCCLFFPFPRCFGCAIHFWGVLYKFMIHKIISLLPLLINYWSVILQKSVYFGIELQTVRGLCYWTLLQIVQFFLLWVHICVFKEFNVNRGKETRENIFKRLVYLFNIHKHAMKIQSTVVWCTLYIYQYTRHTQIKATYYLFINPMTNINTHTAQQYTIFAK